MTNKKLIRKVYIDGNVLVKDGTFIGKDLCIYAEPKRKEDADKIIEILNEDKILEITENFGSPYVDYYVSGGFAVLYKNGASFFCEKISDDLLSRTIKQLDEVRELLDIQLPNLTLYPLLYREQHSAVMSIMENFLYCMILRELIYDRDKLFTNIRTYSNIVQFRRLKPKIDESDDDLYVFLIGYITDFVYHRFSQVRDLYDLVFRLDITDYIKEIEIEVDKRNNIVHRNGKDLNGEPMPINKEEVVEFIEKVQYATTKIWNNIKSQS